MRLYCDTLDEVTEGAARATQLLQSLEQQAKYQTNNVARRSCVIPSFLMRFVIECGALMRAPDLSLLKMCQTLITPYTSCMDHVCLYIRAMYVCKCVSFATSALKSGPASGATC